MAKARTRVNEARDAEIVRLFYGGTNKSEIARLLGISTNGVNGAIARHVENRRTENRTIEIEAEIKLEIGGDRLPEEADDASLALSREVARAAKRLQKTTWKDNLGIVHGPWKLDRYRRATGLNRNDEREPGIRIVKAADLGLEAEPLLEMPELPPFDPPPKFNRRPKLK